MNRLLKASMRRMIKNKMFLFSVIFQIGFALFAILPMYGMEFSVGNGFLLADSLLTLVLSAVFVHFFLRSDYHGGMARNKIITGHSRGKIYISNFISALTGSWIFFLTPIAVSLVLALFTDVTLGVSAAVFAVRMAVFLSAETAMCGIYVLAAFFFKNMGATASFFIALAMFTVSIFCTLNAVSPEDTAEIFESANIDIQLDQSNALNEILLNVLPTSHIVKLMVIEPPINEMLILPLYSLIVIAATTGFGVLLFSGKDLK